MLIEDVHLGSSTMVLLVLVLAVVSLAMVTGILEGVYKVLYLYSFNVKLHAQ